MMRVLRLTHVGVSLSTLMATPPTARQDPASDIAASAQSAGCIFCSLLLCCLL